MKTINSGTEQFDKFIRDNGKIRNCTANIRKMNFLEFAIFDIKNGFFKIYTCDTIYAYKEGIRHLFAGLAGTFFVILFPLTLILRFVFRRR